MRVVLDANVLVSAAISEGPSHRIVQGWLQVQPFELVVCDRLLGEVRSDDANQPVGEPHVSGDSHVNPEVAETLPH